MSRVLYACLPGEDRSEGYLPALLRSDSLTVDETALSAAPSPGELARYGLVVLYGPEVSLASFPEDSALALVSYVAAGGSLLLLHAAAGIGAAPGRFPYAHLAGGAVRGVPEERLCSYVADQSHPILEGFAPFETRESVCFAEIDRFIDKTVFLRAKHLTTAVPAGWALCFGLGRVVALLPGSRAETLRRPELARLILNSARWLTEKKEGHVS